MYFIRFNHLYVPHFGLHEIPLPLHPAKEIKDLHIQYGNFRNCVIFLFTFKKIYKTNLLVEFSTREYKQIHANSLISNAPPKQANRFEQNILICNSRRLNLKVRKKENNFGELVHEFYTIWAKSIRLSAMSC